MKRPTTHPMVIEHILVLEKYFKVQKEMFNLMKESPSGEFEVNSYEVRLMELDQEMNLLSEKLSESVIQLGNIHYTE